MLVASGPPASEARFLAGVSSRRRRGAEGAAGVAAREEPVGLATPAGGPPVLHSPPASRSGYPWHLAMCPGHLSSRPRSAVPAQRLSQCGRGSSGSMLLSGVWSRQASGSAPGEPLLRPGGSKSWYRVRLADLRVACLSKAFLASCGAWTVPVPTTARHSLHLRFAGSGPKTIPAGFPTLLAGIAAAPIGQFFSMRFQGFIPDFAGWSQPLDI